MGGVRVRVPAKINLVLGVGPVRPDGYHELATVFHAVSLFDEVRASPGTGTTLVVDGRHTRGVPTDSTNLAWRAAELLARRAGVTADVQLQVTKGIPVAGGMAGGSADAAGALVACDALWQTGCSRADLLDLAAQLGSDVPFSLVGGTAVGVGRGEQLQPLRAAALRWVVATSRAQLSTPEVFNECDRLRGFATVPVPTVSADLIASLSDGDPSTVAKHLGNDLAAAAISLVPELSGVLAAGTRAGACSALVSGSGPTCVFLVDDAGEPAVVEALTATPGVDQVYRCTGPVGGAEVLSDERAA